jgi:prevent-host-death family protein
MIVISSAELRNNLKKYLDIAKREKVVIQRGRTETFVLTKEEYLEPDEDFARAITMDELLAKVKEDIHEMFKAKGKK